MAVHPVNGLDATVTRFGARLGCLPRHPCHNMAAWRSPPKALLTYGATVIPPRGCGLGGVLWIATAGLLHRPTRTRGSNGKRRTCCSLKAPAALASPLTAEDLQEMPDMVGEYQVTSVCVQPAALRPWGRRSICALVVSDEENWEAQSQQVMWNPPVGSSAMQAISTLGDAFGVLGVWPAAWVAADRVLTLMRSRAQALSRPVRVLEIGCGSGLPSLCALAAGADVVATDLEELPLRLLEEAAFCQQLPGDLQTFTLDVLQAAPPSEASGYGWPLQERATCPSDTEAFDIIVCSDCLYKLDVSASIGRLIARALLRRPMTSVVVTDADRRGRQLFLDTLAKKLGLGLGASSLPSFEVVEVPAWAADDAKDPFSGESTDEVGLLRLYS